MSTPPAIVGFMSTGRKWRLTNLRPGFSPAVDLQAFISKFGEQLPPLNEVINPRFPGLHSLLHGREYDREDVRLLFISVNSRLSVSGGRLCRRCARWVSPSTDAKRFDFENVAFSAHDECLLVLEMHSTTW